MFNLVHSDKNNAEGYLQEIVDYSKNLSERMDQLIKAIETTIQQVNQETPPRKTSYTILPIKKPLAKSGLNHIKTIKDSAQKLKEHANKIEKIVWTQQIKEKKNSLKTIQDWATKHLQSSNKSGSYNTSSQSSDDTQSIDTVFESSPVDAAAAYTNSITALKQDTSRSLSSSIWQKMEQTLQEQSLNESLDSLCMAATLHPTRLNELCNRGVNDGGIMHLFKNPDRTRRLSLANCRIFNGKLTPLPSPTRKTTIKDRILQVFETVKDYTKSFIDRLKQSNLVQRISKICKKAFQTEEDPQKPFDSI